MRKVVLVRNVSRTAKGAPPVLIRCYGRKTESLIDRCQELETLQYLATLNLAPPLYARFPNGYCYGYVPGRPLKPEELGKQDLEFWKLIARQMGKWHRVVKMGESESANGTQDKIGCWQTIDRWLKQSTFVNECVLIVFNYL